MTAESGSSAAPYAALGNRLRTAIRASRFESARPFSAALIQQQVRGASYGMIRNYMSGLSEPSLDFLAAAADTLRVRREWLAWGEGPRTLAEQPGEGERKRMLDGIKAEFPAFTGLEDWQVDAVVQTLGRALAESSWAVDPEQSGRAVGKLLVAGMRAFGLRASRLEPAQISALVSAALPLLSALAATTR
jgi:hypothetical protein